MGTEAEDVEKYSLDRPEPGFDRVYLIVPLSVGSSSGTSFPPLDHLCVGSKGWGVTLFRLWTRHVSLPGVPRLGVTRCRHRRPIENRWKKRRDRVKG